MIKKRAKKCSICGKGIRSWNKSGLCGVCYMKEWKKKPHIKKRLIKWQKEYRKTEKAKELQKGYYQKYKKKKLLKKEELIKEELEIPSDSIEIKK